MNAGERRQRHEPSPGKAAKAASQRGGAKAVSRVHELGGFLRAEPGSLQRMQTRHDWKPGFPSNPDRA